MKPFSLWQALSAASVTKGEVLAGEIQLSGVATRACWVQIPLVEQFRSRNSPAIAGDDAVVILWETLSLHQGFPAAVRAAR